MANAGRGGVGQPVSPAWRRRKKQRGLGAPVSKFSRRKLCQVFLPHQNSSTWIQLRCASFPFRPGGPGLSALLGVALRSGPFFFFFRLFLSGGKILHPGPLPRLLASPGPLRVLQRRLRWPQVHLDRGLARPAPDNNYTGFQAAEGTSEARQAGLSSVWSTRPVVQSWWRSVSVSPQSSRHGHGEALRLDRWSRSCPVLSACSSHHPLSHCSLDGRGSLVEPPAEGGQLVYFAPADSPVKCALHRCVSLFSLGVWDQPPPSATSNQGHSKLKAPPQRRAREQAVRIACCPTSPQRPRATVSQAKRPPIDVRPRPLALSRTLAGFPGLLVPPLQMLSAVVGRWRHDWPPREQTVSPDEGRQA